MTISTVQGKKRTKSYTWVHHKYILISSPLFRGLAISGRGVIIFICFSKIFTCVYIYANKYRKKSGRTCWKLTSEWFFFIVVTINMLLQYLKKALDDPQQKWCWNNNTAKHFLSPLRTNPTRLWQSLLYEPKTLLKNHYYSDLFPLQKFLDKMKAREEDKTKNSPLGGSQWVTKESSQQIT